MSTFRHWMQLIQEARQGRPTEPQAARTIALNAVCPAAIVGLLTGAVSLGAVDPTGRLPWVCTATALVFGFGMAFGVLGVYKLFGFRPISVLADALAGAYCGLLVGAGLICFANLTMLFLMPLDVPFIYTLCPILLIPIGAIAFPLARAWGGATGARRATGQDAAPDRRTEP